MSGLFIFLVSLEAGDFYSRQYETVWNSMLSMLAFMLPAVILFAIALYVRVIMWEKYEELLDRVIGHLKSKEK